MRPLSGCRFVVLFCASVLFAAASASAQEAADATTLLPHPDAARWWLSGQLNLIEQGHEPFASPYDGAHSFRAAEEHTVSSVWTVYTGWALSDRTEVVVDVEAAGGHGLSDALGLAGFTDLDVVRNPSLGSAPYVARAMVRHVIPLGGATVDTPRGPLALARREPARRVEIRAGKMSLVDFFDLNDGASDSHLQFTNWTVDNNGAYDYAADTRGYTVGVVMALVTPQWTLRGAEALMPAVANGITLDWDVSRARGENLEYEWHATPRLVLRTLGYLNHANMGSYAEAIAAFRSGADARPDVEAHRRQGRLKAGAGENVEYALGDRARLFGRAGWNDGRNESFAYTEVDDTLELGGDVTGAAWHRPGDRLGAAFVSNGLSDLHREYLRLGGLGFILGDGTLRYGRETIAESYYTVHLWRGLFASADVQWIANPGYNRDRGPIVVGTTRLHLDF